MAVHAASTLPHIDDVLATGCTGDQRRDLSRCGQTKDAALATQRSDTTCNVGGMALLAQHGWSRLQQRCDCAAMCVVAIAAVFDHRLMLMHKWPALLGMAGVAGVIDTVALDQLGTY